MQTGALTSAFGVSPRRIGGGYSYTEDGFFMAGVSALEASVECGATSLDAGKITSFPVTLTYQVRKMIRFIGHYQIRRFFI
jgi:hypothetical protein